MAKRIDGVCGMTKPTLTPEHIKYLENLRDSGRTNMWGAAPFLAKKFKLSQEDADSLVVQWIGSFDKS